MENPLHSLGYKVLNASLEANSVDPADSAKFSRRGFMLLAASLTSCSAAAPLKPEGAAPVKTTANAGYRTPSLQGPGLRNPDMALSSNFSKSVGVTFTRVMVSGNYIAITFDDGPHPTLTPRLLALLAEDGVRATFFLVGNRAQQWPDVVRAISAGGLFVAALGPTLVTVAAFLLL